MVYGSAPLHSFTFINSLRLMILEVNNVIGTQLNKTDKTSLIYNYVTGHEFRQEMESIVGTFMKLQDDLDSEIRQHQTQWKKREKELSILVKSTSNIYGSLKGIAGNSIKRIESLDIPKIESNNWKNHWQPRKEKNYQSLTAHFCYHVIKGSRLWKYFSPFKVNDLLKIYWHISYSKFLLRLIFETFYFENIGNVIWA